MGDKSPKDKQKQASQKQTKTNSSNQKARDAANAKQALSAKKK